MRLFYPYCGSNWRLVPRHPPPEHRLIIEPFAGSACYAPRHAEHRVLLIEADQVVVAVWHYLIAVRQPAQSQITCPMDRAESAGSVCARTPLDPYASAMALGGSEL